MRLLCYNYNPINNRLVNLLHPACHPMGGMVDYGSATYKTDDGSVVSFIGDSRFIYNNPITMAIR